MTELTLRDLLPTEFKRMDEVVKSELHRDSALQKAFPTALTGVVADKAAGAVLGVLNIDVFGLLAGAWAMARELHPYSTAAGKHPPDETATLFLGEHELAAELHPSVELTFGAIAGALDVDVFEILAGAWAKARELHEYSTAAGKHPAGETSTVFLGEHELAAELHPTVELTFAAVSHVSLKFTLHLAARLRAAQLTIRNGHIIEIGRCDGSVSAQLKYGETPLHDELKSKDLPLIPSLPLPEPGVRIP